MVQQDWTKRGTQRGAGHLLRDRASPGNSRDSHACNGEVDPTNRPPILDAQGPSAAMRMIPGGDAVAVVHTEDLLRAACWHQPEAAFHLRLPGARDQLSEDQVPSVCAQGKKILGQRMLLNLLSSFSPHAGLLLSLLDLKTVQVLVRKGERLTGWPPS